MSDKPASFLTQDAYDRLAAELEELSTVKRAEIVKRIEAAREEGDLKENSGYHAAKDEQGRIESRIRDLTERLKHAVVSEAPESHGVVEAGTLITAVIAGDQDTFLIGSREIAEGTDYSAYSENSPLAAAILGLKIGESTTYLAPNGKEIAVSIVNVETFTG
ncbi:MAG: transcription elongation factor GreA [Microbacteriaceae bacterium]|nr:transcription elongation factor GreA [Microbacteriaceae bacterium]